MESFVISMFVLVCVISMKTTFYPFTDYIFLLSTFFVTFYNDLDLLLSKTFNIGKNLTLRYEE